MHRALSSNDGSPDSSDNKSSLAGLLTNGPAKGEIKPQKACVQCRRSKVRCVHDGGPPCRRCSDAKQECKFRLRADDETWRERTDETLSKLTSAIDTLITRGLPQAPVPQTPPTPVQTRPVMPLRNASTPGHYSGATLPPLFSPRTRHHHTILGMPPSSSSRTAMPPFYPPGVSPHSDLAVTDGNTPSYENGGGVGSSADGTSPNYERKSIPRKRDAPINDGDGYASSHAASAASSHLSSGSRARHASGTSSMMPPPAPLAPGHAFPDQLVPSPTLSHVLNVGGTVYVNGIGGGPRWLMGSTTSYAKATMTIGRDDPRMNAISIGVVSMEKARSLILQFAEKMQPHSFGFPTYPAAEQMTPIIISSLLMVASLHDPHSRALYGSLKNDCIGLIRPDQDVHADLPLDPELGIGVEEITGACIASSWLGGEVGWRVARIARWWAIGYLKHFELPDRNVTVGECLTILPPFRQIDFVDKLRIYLAAYVTEAQQAFILDRPSIDPNYNPAQYVEALRNAFSDSTTAQHPSPSGSANGAGGSASMKFPPPPDRQLVAHASIMSTLLDVQRVQRELRWAAVNADDGRFASYADPSAVRNCVDRLVGMWTVWMEETERWKSECSQLEDLSSSTASAMDVTLTYHLVKAHLGSLAFEPSFHASAVVSRDAANDYRLVETQTHIIDTAKVHALAAMQLACSPLGFRDRLTYLPGFYHFLLGHSAGFLLLLLQRKGRYLLAGEAKTVLETVERFVEVFVSDMATHSFCADGNGVPHPSMATAEALARACQHLRSQLRSV